MAFFEQQEPHFSQRFDIGYGLVVVFTWADKDKIFLKQCDFRESGFRDGQGHNGGVDFSGGQLMQKLRRQGFADMDIQIRVKPRQMTNNIGQEIGCNGGNYANT